MFGLFVETFKKIIDTNLLINWLSWNIPNSYPSNEECPTPNTKLLFLTTSIRGLTSENSWLFPTDENSNIFIDWNKSLNDSANLKLSSSTLNAK